MDIYSVLTYSIGSGSTIGGILWWAVRRTFASTERVEQIESRLTALETKCENMPSAQDLHAVRLTGWQNSSLSPWKTCAAFMS